MNPGILLLDEPTANLDIATRKEIMRTLEDMKAITETVVIATHDMQLVCEWAERIIVLWNGRVVADGSRMKYSEIVILWKKSASALRRYSPWVRQLIQMPCAIPLTHF